MTREEFFSLKEGDTVVCNKDHIPHSHESHYSKNCFYIVSKIVYYGFDSYGKWDGIIFTTSDNQGRKTNGWSASRFDIYSNKKLEEYM